MRVVNCKLLPKKLLYLRILFFGNKIFDEEIIRNRLFVLIQENSIRLKFLLFIKCYDSWTWNCHSESATIGLHSGKKIGTFKAAPFN